MMFTMVHPSGIKQRVRLVKEAKEREKKIKDEKLKGLVRKFGSMPKMMDPRLEGVKFIEGVRWTDTHMIEDGVEIDKEEDEVTKLTAGGVDLDSYL